MTFESRVKWKKELENIVKMGLDGMTQRQIAEHYGVSVQRIHQIVSRYLPGWRYNCGPAVKRNQKEEEYRKKWGNKLQTASDLYSVQRAKFRAKKYNAERVGIEFSISFGNLDWPTHCPILGMEIDYFAEIRQENSVSFDRLDSNKGYIEGNVHIISWRANRIKNDGTAEEHRKIAEFLDSL